MSSKKKLIISLSAVCLVAVIAVVAVVAVLAAGTQAVTSSITVTYRASMVDATVSAKYYILNGETGAVKDGTPVSFKNGNETTLKFEAGAGSSTGTLAVDNIALDSVNQTIIFEYKFTCDSANNGYTGELTIPTEGKTVTNFSTEQFYVSDTEIESDDLKDIEFTAVNASFSLEEKASDEVASTEKYVYIKVSITDVTADADYVAKFNWALNGVANA